MWSNSLPTFFLETPTYLYSLEKSYIWWSTDQPASKYFSWYRQPPMPCMYPILSSPLNWFFKLKCLYPLSLWGKLILRFLQPPNAYTSQMPGWKFADFLQWWLLSKDASVSILSIASDTWFLLYVEFFTCASLFLIPTILEYNG